MSRYDFWTHGVNTIVQYPERAKEVIHTGIGTIIKQDNLPEDSNWLHIPIPTPTVIEGTKVMLKNTHLRFTVDRKAEINEFQLLVDGKSITSAGGFSITGKKWDNKHQEPDFIIDGGLVITLRVRFLSSQPGTITVHGAGARFEQILALALD